MKRVIDNISPTNRRKSIKLIDFTTPDKDESENIAHIQQDLLTFEDQPPPLQLELQNQLKETENELYSLKTLYEEQQLIVNTYRQKEHTTNELISNMKKDMIILENNLSQLQSKTEEKLLEAKNELLYPKENQKVELKAYKDREALTKKNILRLEKRAQMAEAQLSDTTQICNELMLYFSAKDAEQDNLLD
eukprot:NODE_10_length_61504_cov_0.956502.p38 type:complete len:191 gc:universal NODE_10_length_61504_cov_0.956502:41035-41607(+)